MNNLYQIENRQVESVLDFGPDAIHRALKRI